jgi:uncharacterized membrane protein YidH (DUF202 family)
MISLSGVAAADAISTGFGFAICGLLFLREPEETRVQSALEASWIHLDDARSTSWSNSLAVLREVSNNFSRFLDLLFGNELDSPRAFSVSICVSFLVRGSIGMLHGCTCGESASAIRVAARLFFVCAAIPTLVVNARQNNGKASLLWLVMLSAYVLAMKPSAAPMAVAIFALSYLVGVVVIQYQRKLFKASASATSTWHVARPLVLSTIVVIGVFAVPIATANWMLKLSRVFANARWVTVAQFVGLLGSMNLSTVLLLALFTVFASILLIKRAAWSFIERPVYTLQRVRIFEYRKTLGGVGLMFISLGLGRYLHMLIDRLFR